VLIGGRGGVIDRFDGYEEQLAIEALGDVRCSLTISSSRVTPASRSWSP
jgi:hypothetical protein